MRITPKQLQILKLVVGATHSGEWLDIDQLMEAIAKSGGVIASKQSLQCSIRFLERRGYIRRDYETRRERKRVLIIPNMCAFSALGP
jgi:hypothetical protein